MAGKIFVAELVLVVAADALDCNCWWCEGLSSGAAEAEAYEKVDGDADGLRNSEIFGASCVCCC